MDKFPGAEYQCTINNFRLDTCVRRYDEQMYLLETCLRQQKV
jgi:hypothetical protein